MEVYVLIIVCVGFIKYENIFRCYPCYFYDSQNKFNLVDLNIFWCGFFFFLVFWYIFN